jgi:hypothetical protein
MSRVAPRVHRQRAQPAARYSSTMIRTPSGLGPLLIVEEPAPRAAIPAPPAATPVVRPKRKKSKRHRP